MPRFHAGTAQRRAAFSNARLKREKRAICREFPVRFGKNPQRHNGAGNAGIGALANPRKAKNGRPLFFRKGGSPRQRASLRKDCAPAVEPQETYLGYAPQKRRFPRRKGRQFRKNAVFPLRRKAGLVLFDSQSAFSLGKTRRAERKQHGINPCSPAGALRARPSDTVLS